MAPDVIQHGLVQRDGYFETLIFLGAHRSDQAAYLMRLIRVRYLVVVGSHYQYHRSF